MTSGAQDLDAHLTLRTDDRALVGTLRVGPKVPLEQVSTHVFRVFLESRGVVPARIDNEAVIKLVEQVRAGPGAEHAAEVAYGKPPRDGARRTLEWSNDIALRIEQINARKKRLEEEESKPQKSRPVTPDEDAIDFYEQSAFIIVQAGDLLGSVSPPDPGEDGEDIYGNCVPAKKSPTPSDIDTESIQLTTDHKVVAMTRGRLIFSGAERTIETTLHVPGDVGFATGNVDFPGPVEIAGNIKDRFVVKATSNITVRKLVEAATIEGHRDVMLERGCAGRETGSVTARKTLQAGYLEAVTARSGDDCLVRHEITNCTLNVLGMVKIPTGAIRGGVIHAAKGIQAAVIGSAQEVRTELLVGSIPELEGFIEEARKRIEQSEPIARNLADKLEMLNSAGPKATPKQIEEKMEIDFAHRETLRRANELQTAIDRVFALLNERTTPRLHVAQCVNAATVVWLPGWKVTFRNELRGESVLRLDARGNPIFDYKGETHPASKLAHAERDTRVPARPASPDAEQMAA